MLDIRTALFVINVKNSVLNKHNMIVQYYSFVTDHLLAGG